MIKLFEEYNQYYTQIFSEEWHAVNAYPYKGWENFTEEEISYIENKIVDNHLFHVPTIEMEHPWGYGPLHDSKPQYLKIKTSIAYYEYYHLTIWIDIIKLKDEWYYVMVKRPTNDDNRKAEYEGLQFKCDQFDGVLKCIEDNLVTIEGLASPVKESIYDYEYKKSDDTEYLNRPMKDYEWDDIKEEDTIPFTKDEISNIEKINNKIYLKGFKRITNGSVLTFFSRKFKCGTEIIKLNDDWFAVRVNISDNVKSDWKCDQLGGLLKLLKKLSFI